VFGDVGSSLPGVGTGGGRAAAALLGMDPVTAGLLLSLPGVIPFAASPGANGAERLPGSPGSTSFPDAAGRLPQVPLVATGSGVVPPASLGGMTSATAGLDQLFAELGGPPPFDADAALALALGAEQPRRA
jgi:hypothetical protein